MDANAGSVISAFSKEFNMAPHIVRNTFLFSALLVSGDLLAAEGKGETEADGEYPRAHFGLRVGSEMTGRFDGEWNFDADTPYGAYAGWNVSDHWALDFGYTDIGNTSTRVNAAQDYLRADGHMLNLGLNYRRPIAERFDLFASVGVFDLREAANLSNLILDPPPIGYGPFRNDDTGTYIELGVRYRFNGPIALRASYQWFDFDHGADGTPWIGLEFGF